MKAHVLKEMESSLGWSIRDRASRHGVGAREATGRAGSSGSAVWLGFFWLHGALQVGKTFLCDSADLSRAQKQKAARFLKTEAQTRHSIISISC